MGAAILSAFLVSSAFGQARCPAGTRAQGGLCVKDSTAAWAAPGGPAGTPAAGAALPLPVAAQAPAEKHAMTCEGFKAAVAAFHREQAGAFESEGRRHLQLESSLAAEAENAGRLASDLERQARASRDAAIRRHLAGQAREARGAQASASARLKEAVKKHREDEERFKDLYKIRAKMLLEKRPPGCAVGR